MYNCVELKLEDDTIRFTPDGRIAVIDAIGALSDNENPHGIWKDLKNAHPGIVDTCGDYTFPR